MDIVYVRGLEVKTVIGVYDWEREIKQPISVDLDMGTDISRAAQTDEHAYVLDYKTVCERVAGFIEHSKLQLLEARAEEIAAWVRSEFKVQWVRGKVSKPAAITGARDVGVIIERGSRAQGAQA